MIAPDLDELLGVGVGEGPKKHGTKDTEDRRVRADADRERQQRDDRE